MNQRPTIGIPYAFAGVDARGAFVTCPECGQNFYGCDESQRTVEDAMTKGASAYYAQHYDATHA
jgi:phage terminase large subunit GpA-like protein